MRHARVVLVLLGLVVPACSARIATGPACVGTCGDGGTSLSTDAGVDAGASFADAGRVADSGATPDAGVGATARGAYARCEPGEACAAGTACVEATFTSTGRAANTCSLACHASSECPPLGPNSPFAPTCVIGTTGVGRCYDTCGMSDLDCGAGTICVAVPGALATVCVPTGSEPVSPTASPPYARCTLPGAACMSGTTCTPASFMRGGAAQGNHCTIACTRGNAAMCPGYVVGAAQQLVECLVPNGNAAAAQCVRRCIPGNGNANCEVGTVCATVVTAAGPIGVCVP